MTSRGTLRGRLIRATLLSTLLALVLSASLFLSYEFMETKDEREQDLRAQAALLAQSVVPTLVFNDPATAMLQLRSLQQKRGLRSADVYTASGASFAHFASDGSPVARPQIDAPQSSPSIQFSGRELALQYPVFHDGERVGSIHLLAEHDIFGRIASYALFACAAVAMSLAMALFLFSGLVRRLMSPLTEVASIATQVMERRDWRLRAPRSEIRELAKLVDSFNGMLAEVQTVTAALESEMAQRSRIEADLRQADKRKDEFLATLAHELRNPLAPMTSAVSILGRAGASEAMRASALQMMQRQLKHTVRLIDDLLDVSRMTTGKLALHPETVDLDAVLRVAIEAIESTACKVELSYRSTQAAAACRVRGDQVRLLQVFSNLLNNACKYTPAGGHVRLQLDRTATQAVVTVNDDGIGIDPEMQARIFDMFEQVDKSLERGNAGLGVGLTLARQLVELHGGTLSVHSDGLGCGTSFAVLLPLPLPLPLPLDLPPALHTEPAFDPAFDPALYPVSDPVAVAPALSPMQDPHLKLLVADADVGAALRLQALLRMLGHEVEVAHDGRAALAAAKSARPDVAVVDIGMPGLSGEAVAKRLREDPDTAAMGLIALTARGQAADPDRAARAGFDACLSQPVEAAALQDALLRVARRRGAAGASSPASPGSSRLSSAGTSDVSSDVC